LGTVYFNLIDINLKKEDLEEALRYAQLAEPIITVTQPNRLGYLYEGYANIYKGMGQDNQALSFYNRAIEYAVEYEQWGEASSTAEKLSEYYEEKNMLQKALEFARKTTEYRKNFLEETKVEAIEKYRIAFESDQQEFQIAQLEALNEANRQRITAQQRVQNLIIGIGIGLLLVGIVITFLVMRFRLQKVTLSNKVKLAELNNKLVLNRLSPHFIFNVLNSIQYYINSNDRKNANHYLARFADLLRKFLESFSEEYHQLSEELNLINEYIALEQMLKNESFQFSISVDENVDEKMNFPTMLLQPLIENAIKHGTTDTNPQVNVRVNKEENTVVCVIEDNGTGMIERESKHRSRGIEMSKERISLLNQATKSKYSLIWENKRGNESGLRITLNIPL
jgi:signal transduction histidine kinase